MNTLANGPILFLGTFVVPTTYKSGIYTPTTTINQCGMYYYNMLLVGSGTLNGVQYWIVKTHLGPLWGLQGFMWLARNDALLNYGITCTFAQPRFD